MPVKLGDRVRDRISGYEGIVVGICEWLYGCRRPIVQSSELKDGKPMESHSFDEPQLEILQEAAFVPNVPTEVQQETPARPGGPRNTPARRPDPTR